MYIFSEVANISFNGMMGQVCVREFFWDLSINKRKIQIAPKRAFRRAQFYRTRKSKSKPLELLVNLGPHARYK